MNRTLTPHSYLTIKDIIDLTSLSDSTIRRNIYKGSLKASRKVGKILIKVTDYEKWLGRK